MIIYTNTKNSIKLRSPEENLVGRVTQENTLHKSTRTTIKRTSEITSLLTLMQSMHI